MSANSDQKASKSEVGEFQGFLDQCFPIGALCVEFEEADDRLSTTGRELVTGRVLCTGARRARSGRWQHRLVIDPRKRQNDAADVLDVWISTLRRHNEISDLWEASVVGNGSKHRTIRLLADPEPPWRPTPTMRRAVSKAHGVA